MSLSRKGYEIAIQEMNGRTCHNCCNLVVLEVRDLGINFITSGRTIQQWNLEFRKKEKFSLPRNKSVTEPKLFSFF